jgi:hypothetical protein
MAKLLSDTPIAHRLMSPAEADKIIARVAIAEAKNGNPWPLISRLRSNRLTEDELNYISESGIRHGDRGRAYIREVRDVLICMQFKGLIDKGVKGEAAVATLQKQHGLKRSSLFDILKKSSRGG